MSDELSALIEEFKFLLENGDKIPPEAARRVLLALSIDTNLEVKKINGRLKKVETAVEELKKDWKEHPSLLWLLRFKTKQTVGIIILVFGLLSVLYISGLRVPVLEWLGLPPLLP